MADDIDVTPGVGKTVRTEDIAGKQYPVTKIVLGASGAADMDVDSGQQTSANSVPVVLASDQSTVPVAEVANLVEDAVPAANATGKVNILIRQDTPAGLVDTDGDAVAQRGTNYGAAFVQILTSSGSFVDSFGGGTQYTEDAAAAANPTGTAPILVRQDTPGSLVDTDGDNVAQRGTNYGAAFCQIVTSSGAFVDSFGGSGGTSHQDDAAFSIGSASSITPMGALANETTPDSVDEGDVGVPRMTLDRKLLIRVVGATDANRLDIDASGRVTAIVEDGGGSITVDAASLPLPTGAATEATLSTLNGKVTACDTGSVAGTVTANAGTNLNTSALALESGGNLATIAGDTTSLDTKVVVGGGTEAGAVRVTIASDSTGVLTVDDGGGSLTVDAASLPLPTGAASETTLSTIAGDTTSLDGKIVVGAGTEAGAVRVTIATDSTGVLTVDDGGGSITVDAASLPLPTGAATESTLSTLNGKVTACDTDSVSLVSAIPAGTFIIGATREVSGAMVDQAGNARAVAHAYVNASASGNTQVVAAQGAGVKIRVLSYTLVSAGTVSVKFQSATTDITSLKALVANTGIAATDDPSGLFQTAANEALNINLSAAIAVGVDVTYIPVA